MRAVPMLAAGVLLGGCGGGGPAAPAGRSPTGSTLAPAGLRSPTPAPTPPSRSPSQHPSVDPLSPDGLLAAADASGRRSQTHAEPVQDGRFRARVGALWSAVVTGRPQPALALFFPLPAYRQVKALADPAADWRDRLVGLYDLDVGTVHDTVPRGSRLLGATVPAGAATWVRPGEESNRLGYWRVYGTRVVYRTPAGAEASFGICSLIGWRGEWYAVHLGPVDHPAGVGALCP